MSEIIVLDSDEDNDCIPVNESTEQNMPRSLTAEIQNETASCSTRRRPRKSVLSVKPNTEIQFEAIPGEDVITTTKTTSPKKQQQKHLNISNNPNTDVLCEKFFDYPEVKDLMNRIAEERVRINYLLAASDLPEMKFSLYTMFEELENQFKERLSLLNQPQDEDTE